MSKSAGNKSGNRGGRPPLPDHLRRQKTDIWLTAAEYADISKRAARAGVPVRAYVRDAALSATIQMKTPIPELNREAWQKLAPLATNLNTIARNASPADGDLVDLVKQVLAQVKQLRLELYGADRDGDR